MRVVARDSFGAGGGSEICFLFCAIIGRSGFEKRVVIGSPLVAAHPRRCIEALGIDWSLGVSRGREWLRERLSLTQRAAVGRRADVE